MLGYFIVNLVNNLFEVYLWIMIARIILSWVRPNPSHPLLRSLIIFVYQMTEPVMRPFRQILPAMGGLDFSPILVFVALHLARRVVLTLLVQLFW